MQIDLAGRVALVTGATRGIGRAIAQSLEESGAAVAAVGRDAARAESVASELGGKARGFGCDVSDVAAVVSLLASVESAMGSLDILVNNAGITRDNILPRMKDSEWSEVIDANLRGAFATTRAAVRGMMKRRWGRVINISSIVGLTGNAGQSNYAASKAGLIGFTKSVAREYGSRNITCNAVAPGYVRTELTTGSLTDEMVGELVKMTPIKREGTAEDVAAAVAFLCSERARFITGQVIAVDGGLSL